MPARMSSNSSGVVTSTSQSLQWLTHGGMFSAQWSCPSGHAFQKVLELRQGLLPRPVKSLKWLTHGGMFSARGHALVMSARKSSRCCSRGWLQKKKHPSYCCTVPQQDRERPLAAVALCMQRCEDSPTTLRVCIKTEAFLGLGVHPASLSTLRTRQSVGVHRRL